ncbi:Protein kinase-like domain like protein [Zymoseptoria brevis]|uniref:non-specific serine/threonine protein kinase n=1 Tax=Zymoseptoria brevis TaxID=1047168 RepID=A0A0F4GD35_9PEZI|nr:Protein kinase-like domain like protein [Zymoseptoria brevis]
MLAVRLWLGSKIFGPVGIVGVRVAPKRMIKWNCEEPELEALRYAAANTSIPIPRLYRAHSYRGHLALEMEFFPGCDILQVCWRKYSQEQKAAIVDEVSGYIAQLRQLEPSHLERISSTDGGPCRDIRIGSVRRFGPFDDSLAFHQCVRGGVPEEHAQKFFGDEVMRVHRREYNIRFTHGDLSAQNILVRGGKVVAIIDWECAGWYPEYWEYTKAHYNSVYLPEFYEMLRQKIERYDDELKAERILWDRMDQPLDEVRA